MTAMDYFVQVYDGLGVGAAASWMAETEQLSLAPYPEYELIDGTYLYRVGADWPLSGMIHG